MENVNISVYNKYWECRYYYKNAPVNPIEITIRARNKDEAISSAKAYLNMFMIENDYSTKYANDVYSSVKIIVKRKK
jgi:hypothetical protein